MRWMYVLPRLLLVLMLWAFLNWGLDPLLRQSAVLTAQAVTGARADISDFSTSFYPPRLTVRGTALASSRHPGINLLEFEELSLALEGDPLLRRQFVVREGRLTGLRFGTPREDDGQLPQRPAPPVDPQPSWLQEQLKSIGSEWLSRLTDDARSRLDPNTLQTYRVGSEVQQKWEDRLQSAADRSRLMQIRCQQLRQQFDDARRADPVQQLQRFLQLARQAELLNQDVEQLRLELTELVPDVRNDLTQLEQARQNDLDMIRHQLELLRPDGRRISESLIGETMYCQLQQLLSWVELARHYQQDLKEQTQPARVRGTDFHFPLGNTGPDFVLRKLLISGRLAHDQAPMNLEAVLTNVTNNASLLGQPAVLRLRADGQNSLLLQVTLDATGDESRTQIAASWKSPEGPALRAGKANQAALSVQLAEIDWHVNVTLVADQLQGTMRLQARLQDADFLAGPSIRPEFVQAAREALSHIQNVDASLDVSGPRSRPQLQLDSNLGPQIGDGLRKAFTGPMQLAQQRLSSELTEFATDQTERLKAGIGRQYQLLLNDNASLIAQIQEVQSVVAAVRSGNVDPAQLIRQVTDSKLLPEKQQQSVDRATQSVDRAAQEAEKLLQKSGLPTNIRGFSSGR